MEWLRWSGKFVMDLPGMEWIEHRLSLDTIVKPKLKGRGSTLEETRPDHAISSIVTSTKLHILYLELPYNL